MIDHLVMENRVAFELEYSFDDEPVIGYYYDLRGRRIEIHFEAYYDLQDNDRYIERPCRFVIENWKEGRSKIGDEPKFEEPELKLVTQ